MGTNVSDGSIEQLYEKEYASYNYIFLFSKELLNECRLYPEILFFIV